MSDIAVRVENLSKLYRIGQRERYKALRDTLTDVMYAPIRRIRSTFQRFNVQRSNDSYIWALKDVSFEVRRGEVVGIIGRNGAGKTTLLKILSRITDPTEGYAEILGRVGSLLEVGTGFHPELTGRENIYLNGAILGMKKAEIDRKFDEIVDFAEIEKFIDTPVKRYSSGMYVRLAFAVAAHLELEILLVDEVLAVGDAAFQRKCLGKMGDVAYQGRTVLFVSHNMTTVTALCSQCYHLDRGHIVVSGKTSDVVQRYVDTIHYTKIRPLTERTDRRGDGRVRFTQAALLSGDGNPIETAFSGQSIVILLSYAANQDISLNNVVFSIGVYKPLGQFLFFCNNEMSGTVFDRLPPTGVVRCMIPRLPLSPGRYDLNINVEVNGVQADWVPQAIALNVEGGDFFGTGRLPPSSHGGFLVPQSWSISLCLCV